MVAVVTLGWLSLLKASMIAAGLMILTRCCRAEQARQNVSWRLLIIIAAAFGIGRAMEITGAANSIAEACVSLAFGSPWAALVVIYLITVLFTAIITSHATAALIFPIAIQTAHNLGVNHEPFIFVLIVAAAASFITPFAYPTNLMVFGPGGYKFSDFVRIGLPLNLLVGITAVILIPFIWPFG